MFIVVVFIDQCIQMPRDFLANRSRNVSIIHAANVATAKIMWYRSKIFGLFLPIHGFKVCDYLAIRARLHDLLTNAGLVPSLVDVGICDFLPLPNHLPRRCTRP